MVKEALQTDDATKYKDGLMSMHSQTESYHSAIFSYNLLVKQAKLIRTFGSWWLMA